MNQISSAPTNSTGNLEKLLPLILSLIAWAIVGIWYQLHVDDYWSKFVFSHDTRDLGDMMSLGMTNESRWKSRFVNQMLIDTGWIPAAGAGYSGYLFLLRSTIAEAVAKPLMQNKPPVSAADEIARLHSLKVSGAISAEEFEALKRKTI